MYGANTFLLQSDIATDTTDTNSAQEASLEMTDEGTPDVGDEGKVSNVLGQLPEVGSASMLVSEQAAGNEVLVERVSMHDTGWIVVHEVINGHISNALGATRRDAGEHTDVTVSLLRNTEPSGSYVVVLYSDNGNGTFEISLDLPIVDESGEALIQAFNTTAE